MQNNIQESLTIHSQERSDGRIVWSESMGNGPTSNAFGFGVALGRESDRASIFDLHTGSTRN